MPDSVTSFKSHMSPYQRVPFRSSILSKISLLSFPLWPLSLFMFLFSPDVVYVYLFCVYHLSTFTQVRLLRQPEVLSSQPWEQCFSWVQFSLTVVSDSCDPMDRSPPGFPCITNSQSLLKLMSIESVMPSSHLILCRPLLLLPSIFPSIRVFSNESVLSTL